MFDLIPEQLEELHAATLKQDAMARPDGNLSWKQIKAAILISSDHYLYQYKVSSDPLRFGYKYLSPQTLARAFSLEAIDSGWISPDIIRAGSNSQGDWAVLWVPRQKHQIEISGAGQDGADLKLNVPLPAMVFVGINQDYWLCAVSKAKFDPKAQALAAPLPNVYCTSGKICWGVARPPVATSQTLPQAWKVFMDSLFSGHEIHGKSQQFPKNVIRQLKAVAGRRTYPAKDLQPIRSYANTIDDFLKQTLDP